MSKLTQIPSTVSILEGGSGTKPEIFSVIHIPKITNSTYQLNQSEITFVKQMLNVVDKAIKEEQQHIKSLKEMLWLSCDKANPDTEGAYRELNKVKAALKKTRAMRHQIANVNAKLKQQSKNI